MRRVVILDDPAASAGGKRKSPGQVARDIRRAEKHRATLAALAEENERSLRKRRVERQEFWADGGRDEFLAYRQDTDLAELGQQRRELRAAARASAASGRPEVEAAHTLGIAPGPVEGAEFRKGDPVRRLGA